MRRDRKESFEQERPEIASGYLRSANDIISVQALQATYQGRAPGLPNGKPALARALTLEGARGQQPNHLDEQ